MNIYNYSKWWRASILLYATGFALLETGSAGGYIALTLGVSLAALWLGFNAVESIGGLLLRHRERDHA